MRIQPLRTLALLAAVGCDKPTFDDEETRKDCAAGATVTSEVYAPGAGQTVSGDLTITGAAEHSLDLTIRELKVLGVPAENTGFNYGTWKATIPFSLLASLADEAVEVDGRKVLLTITVSETCGGGTPQAVTIDPEEATIYIEPRVPLGALTVTLAHAGDATYNPPTGEDATLTITAAATYAGAKVQLDGPGVLFDAVADRAATRLDAGGKATVMLRSKQPGDNPLTVRAGDDVTGALLRVGGRPLLTPTAVTLTAGESVLVSGKLEGDIAAAVRCTATASAYATVMTASNEDLTAGVTFDPAADRPFEFTVRAAAAVMPDIVTVSCHDEAHDQYGTSLAVSLK